MPCHAPCLDKMLAAKNFQSGMQTLRQIEFSLFDMLLHTALGPARDLRCATPAGAGQDPAAAIPYESAL